MDEPALRVVGEEIVHGEATEITTSIVTHHQPQLGAALGAQDPGQGGNLGGIDGAVQLALSHEADVTDPGGEFRDEDPLESIETRHASGRSPPRG